MHSINIEQTNKFDLFTKDQFVWINNQKIPNQIYLKLASEFDDKYVNTSSNRWEYRFSGENQVLDFDNSINFKTLPDILIKLIKIVTIQYFIEHSGSNADDLAAVMGQSVRLLKSFTHESVIEILQSTHESRDFYYLLYAFRKLESLEFFKSTDDEDLEEKLLYIKRPYSKNWGIYSEFDNILPPDVVSMIGNGLLEWASKYAPRLNTYAEKRQQLEYVSKHVGVEPLLDCVILGLLYITGARPVQLSKIAVGDIFIDAQSDKAIRYALLIPYAKKIRLNINKIIVALPEELGKLILLYQTIANLEKGSPLLPQNENAEKIVNRAIAQQLFRFSPKETQIAIQSADIDPPKYNASQFRHHVAHTLAMSGASAEEIAYLLGHSNTVVASHYISATPNLADIREKALGSNPVFKNMIALMLTGNLIHSYEWTGRKVAGQVGNKFHYHIGGCSYEEQTCPFAEVRACYGCLYFKPFLDGLHLDVFDGFNQEIIDLIKICDETGQQNHPLIPELTRRKAHVNTVMLRIELHNSSGRNRHA